MLSLLADNFIDFKIYEVHYDFNLLHDNRYIIRAVKKVVVRIHLTDCIQSSYPTLIRYVSVYTHSIMVVNA
jgi:hypothetical protein